MSLRESYKKPTEQTGTQFKKPFPLSQGKNLFRLVPPLPQFEMQGWYVWGATHFGYTVLTAEGKKQYRPFACPRDYNRKTKVEKVPCAECNKIEKYQNEYKDMAHDYSKQVERGEMSQAQMDSLLLDHATFLEAHNRSSKYYIPVMNSQGEFGYIAVGKSVVDGLRARIAELETENIDPWSPDEGAIFNVQRTGEDKYNTEYSVSVEQEAKVVDGRTYKVTKLAPLSDAQLEAAVRDIPNLHNLSTKISQRQLEMLAASDGSPEVVASILGLDSGEKTTTTRKPLNTNATSASYETAQQHAQELATLSKTHEVEVVRGPGVHTETLVPKQNLAPAHADAAAELDEEEVAKAQLAAIQARKAEKFKALTAAPAPVVTASPVPPSADPKVAAAEFMKRYGNK